MKTALILLAAGAGTRADPTGEQVPKAFRKIAGDTPLGHSFSRLQPAVDHVVIVTTLTEQHYISDSIKSQPNVSLCTGGDTRAHSVFNALRHLKALAFDGLVFIHDVARCFMPASVLVRLQASTSQGVGCIPTLPIVDTVRKVDTGLISGDVDRDQLVSVQTPQAFLFDDIFDAYMVTDDLRHFTDDASVARAAGTTIRTVSGHADGFKLTYPEDFQKAEKLFAQRQVRTGSGYDVHRFGVGDHVVLCGVKVPHTHGLIGHSDADVGLHALTDAILGACALGDIGQHFPPNDPKWKGAASDQFVKHAAGLALANGYRVGNVGITLICERPKIGPHRDQMRARVAEILDVKVDAISVKATTTEGLGFTGRAEGIAAQCVVTMCDHA